MVFYRDKNPDNPCEGSEPSQGLKIFQRIETIYHRQITPKADAPGRISIID